MKKGTITAVVLVTLIVFAVGLSAMAAEDATKRVLRDAIVGAGTGAISAEASGGKAGKGALIGAGTGALGGVLMDVLTQPSSSDETKAEKAVATQEVYQMGYEEGYKAGFKAGFDEGVKQASPTRAAQ